MDETRFRFTVDDELEAIGTFEAIAFTAENTRVAAAGIERAHAHFYANHKKQFGYYQVNDDPPRAGDRRGIAGRGERSARAGPSPVMVCRSRWVYSRWRKCVGWTLGPHIKVAHQSGMIAKVSAPHEWLAPVALTSAHAATLVVCLCVASSGCGRIGYDLLDEAVPLDANAGGRDGGPLDGAIADGSISPVGPDACGTDALVSFCSTRQTETAPDSLGSGSRNDPFVLCSAAQLVALGEHPEIWDAHFRLGADVDLGAFDETTLFPIGDTSSPFRGSFDGCGHRITAFHRASPALDSVGLFGVVGGPGATIRNVHLDAVDVAGRDWVGALAGVIERGASVTACSASGRVSGREETGGLVGLGRSARIGMSSTDVSVEVTGRRAGGLIGSLTESRLEASCTTGDTHSSATEGGAIEYLGGLAGMTYYSRVVDAYAVGSVGVDGSSGARVGGLIGRPHQGEVANAFASGTVSVPGALVAEVGRVVGYDGSLDNVWFSPDTACTSSAGATCNGLGLAAPANDPTYFFDPANEPLAGWDFAAVWQAAPGAPPTLAPVVFNPDAWGTCADHLTDAPFAGGTGNAASPFLVCTPAHLAAISGLCASDPDIYARDAHYRLMQDVDVGASAVAVQPIGSAATPFQGVFDGNGWAVVGMTMIMPAADDVGLFGYVGEKAMVVNLTVRDAFVEGAAHVGLIAGQVYGARIIGCHADGTVYGTNDVGGLVGLSTAWSGGGGDLSTVELSAAQATVTGVTGVGGLVGSNGGHITDCFATSTVTGTTSVGGLVGKHMLDPLRVRVVSRSYATGGVTGTAEVGGLVGSNGADPGAVVDSFSVGSVTGSGTGVGRIVGAGAAPTSSSYDCTSICNGCNAPASPCVDVTANPGYFFLPTSPPLTTWGTGYWLIGGSTYPALR